MKGFECRRHKLMEKGESTMEEVREEQLAIRQYLLGNLSDEKKMRQIEEQILLDDDFNDRLLAAEEELIEEYLEGNLSDSERAQFADFFLNSSERRADLRLAQNLRRYSKFNTAPALTSAPQKRAALFDWKKIFSPPVLGFAVLILLILGVGWAVWRIASNQSEVDKGLAELRAAYRGQRPLESRTSANFDYVPFTETRGATPSVTPDTKARSRAEGYLLNATENSSDAKAHQALGLLYLAEKKFELALNEFNLALNSAPNDAAIHTDIGAALLEKAKQSEREEKFAEAMEARALALQALNRALEIDPQRLEALFNRALALQKMANTNQAKEAWEKYLEKDSESPWAGEARKNLDLLKQQSQQPKDKSQILPDFLDAFNRKDEPRAWTIASQTKELITDVMIQIQLAQNFLEASRENRQDEAARFLSAFVYLGELEKQYAKDQYFQELAAYYSRTTADQRQKLLLAHQELQKGHKLILISNFKSALEVLNSSKQLFSEAGNEWESWLLEHRISYCLSRLDQIRQSNERLLLLSEFCDKKNYKWLQTLADNLIGSNYSLLGEHSKAIEYNRKSLKTAQEINDTYNIQKTLGQLSNEYWLIGDSRQTLASIYQTLNLPNLYYQSPRQKDRNLLFAVEGLYRFKFYDAAAAFAYEEAYLAENELKDRWLSITAHNHLAMIYAKAGKYQLALQEIEAGFRLANSFEDEAMRRNQNTYTRLNLAHLQRESNNCQEAIENYNDVIRDYENSDFSINNYEARKGRLLCYVALGDDSSISKEMPSLIKVFDENRQTLTEESDRNIFFDNEQNVYDIATDYAYTRLHDSDQAFNYAENSRARSLLSFVGSNSTQPLTARDLRQSIPPETQIIYYAVMPDKVLIWLISTTKFDILEKPIKADELNDKIELYLELLTAHKNSRNAGQELYSLLIEPVEAALELDKSLCIIADKNIIRIPFASLVSPKTNKHLIESFNIFYAPSATLLIKETEIAKQKKQSLGETILSIGNPSFSRHEYPNLDDLPDAVNEAREIARLYESPLILTDKEATKEQVVNNLNKPDVLHFAGHYVPNSKSPALSKLLLASDDLSVEEIMRRKLTQTRLIILSACETGVEKFYKGEGMIGAARAFLAADVPLIVASRWAVDSAATAQLMIRFHHHRKQQKLSTFAALRQAQIDLLTDEKLRLFREPFYWAGFLPVGGYAEY